MIKVLELDPNGLCNAKCWYCPVAYGGNPAIGKKNMSLEDIENVLAQISEGRGDFVDKDMSLVINAHYNEVLLYPYFKEMIKLYRKYGFKTILFSNGTTLTQEKIDFIGEYSDVIQSITLNIPSAFSDEWGRLVGMNEKIFDKMIDNLRYASKKIADKVNIGIQVNGIQEESLFKNGGGITLLKNAPNINQNTQFGDVAKSVKSFKKLFPNFSVFSDVHLNDRSGKLKENNVLSSHEIIKLQADNFSKRVVGCAGGEVFSSSRSEEWLHINANGDVIICCHDYDFVTAYINIKDKNIKDIWNGPERKEMIEKSYNSFCRSCKYAIWE